MNTGYNPDFNPTGIEGGIDTLTVPWLSFPGVQGLQIKPLRASAESGMFSAVMRMEAGAGVCPLVFLGAMDLMVLSGRMRIMDGPLATELSAGIWGYVPASCRINATALEDCEFLANCYGPIAVLDAPGGRVARIVTAFDIARLAAEADQTLVPNTLAECMQARPASEQQAVEPLAFAAGPDNDLVEGDADAAPVNPHFIDTRALPWIVNPDLPDIALKVLRVSEETGIVSLIVRHNGVAGPHYHLGAADFLVLNGRIGYRAGPPEGYGPGVWFYEPAGARHEATQRLGDEDLIYTANVYGPIQFDSGVGTPIVAVQSWMQYKELADAQGVELVRSKVAGDDTLLAWAPLVGQA